MRDFVAERLKPDQVFTKKEAVDWFAQRYGKVNPATVQMHVEGMSVNNLNFRRSHPNIRPGSRHDLFYKIESGRFRLWNESTDGPPKYRGDVNTVLATPEEVDEIETAADEEGVASSAEFAFEKDLKNYLAKNLAVLEAGLKLYEDEDGEISGIEYPVGGRFIDILAIDKSGEFVVVELKVSRGYEKTIGQILRYMAYIQKNLAKGARVRGIIVANEISEDLKMAASLIPDVRLAEYQISFKLRPLID
jgi:hypothetical protein